MWGSYVQLSADPGSDEGDYGDPWPEGDELLNSGQDAEVTEEAIRKFMDSYQLLCTWMEAS
jgi:hypothetical protein